MLGLTPAVWITEATVPRPAAVSKNPVTAARSVTSQLTAVGVIPSSCSTAAAASSRSCRTSQSTTVWSRPTILAVARPIPPAPPVITVTRLIRGPYTASADVTHRGSAVTHLLTTWHPNEVVENPERIRRRELHDLELELRVGEPCRPYGQVALIGRERIHRLPPGVEHAHVS